MKLINGYKMTFDLMYKKMLRLLYVCVCILSVSACGYSYAIKIETTHCIIMCVECEKCFGNNFFLLIIHNYNRVKFK